MMNARDEIPDADDPHLVWVSGTGGPPHAQKWNQLYYGPHNAQRKRIVGSPVKLTQIEWRSPLDVLAKLYPCPPSGGED